jgi:hypothetical protein
MRKRLKQQVCFVFCLFLSFFTLLYCITEYRENSYDFLVQLYQLPEEMRRQGMDKQREYQRQRLEMFPVESPLDEILVDPPMIEYGAEIHADAFMFEHDFWYDLVPSICEREPRAFPLRFFHVYGKLYSFENLRHVTLLGLVLGYDLGPYSDSDSVLNDMGAAILDWESEGNTREGEWLDKFLASPEYEVFLQDLCAQIEFFEGKSLEDMAEEICEVSESHSLLSELKTPFLTDAKKLAPIVYENYQKDKHEGTISRITFEARILQELYERVLWIEKCTPYQFRNLRWARSFLPDPFVDLGGIFVCSVIISLVITYLVSRKYLK